MCRLAPTIFGIVAVCALAGCETESSLNTFQRGLDIDSSRLRPGIAFSRAEGGFDSAAQAQEARFVKSGIVPRVELPAIGRGDRSALRFDGYLRVPFDDRYVFELTSDNITQLHLNNHIIVDIDGQEAAGRKTGTIALGKGHHRLRILRLQSAGGRDLALRVRWGDGPFQAVPDEWFYVLDPLTVDRDLPLTDAP